MSRFVSLLLAASSLAAVGLAQPAQAYWTKGKPYYDSHNAAPTLGAFGTTISTTPIGTVTITSSPPGYPFTTSGSFSGNVDVDYTWAGPGDTPTVGFSCTNGYAASGSTSGPGVASSSVGGSQTGGAYGTTTNAPNNSYFSGGSSGFVYNFLGSPPSKFTLSVPLTVNTSEYYVGPATASAAFTFGAPIVQ